MTEYTPEKVAEARKRLEAELPRWERYTGDKFPGDIRAVLAALTAVSAERDKAEANHRRVVRLNNDLVDSKMLLVAHFAKATAAGERILADALKVSAERDRYRRLLRRTELQCQDAEYESGALRRAITEALDHDPLHGRSEGLHCGGMSPCMRGILRAALDKEGEN